MIRTAEDYVANLRGSIKGKLVEANSWVSSASSSIVERVSVGHAWKLDLASKVLQQVLRLKVPKPLVRDDITIEGAIALVVVGGHRLVFLVLRFLLLGRRRLLLVRALAYHDELDVVPNFVLEGRSAPS